MRSVTPGARNYLVGLVTFAALLLVYAWFFRPAPARGDLIPFVLLTAGAAIAHLYPVRSAREGAFYVVATVFVFAAAILLPLPLLGLHCLLAMLPHTLWNYRKRRIMYRWSFNTAQTLVSAFAVRSLFLISHRSAFEGPASLVIIVTAAVAFPVMQGFLVAVMLRLDNGTRILSSPALDRDSLMAESTMTLLGALVAAVWHAQPWFAALLPFPMAIMYTLVRRIEMVPLAEIDAKTGLYNYRHFEQTVSTEFIRAKAMRRPMSILFMDLDYMRHINNRYGHLAGDYVLKELAGILTRETRHGDLVARFGGEEFVALLPGTDKAEATYVAEKIRHAVEHHPYCFESQQIGVTVSIGVVAYPVDGNEVAQLMQRADEALYAAKAAGRNRVQAAGSTGEVHVPPELRTPGMGPAAAMAHAAAAVMAPPLSSPAMIRQAQCSVPPDTSGQLQTPPLTSSWLVGAMPQLLAAGGALALVWSLSVNTGLFADWRSFGALVAGAVVAELLTVQIYEGNRQKITISMGVGAILAAVALLDLTAALLVGLAGGIVHTVLSRKLEWSKIAFNLGNIALSTAASAGVYALFPVDQGPGRITLSHLTGPTLAAVAFFVINTGLISLYLGLRTRRNPLSVWKENLWFAPAFILSGLTGAFLGAMYEALGPVGVVIFLTPILVLRFFFSLYAERMQRSIVALEAAKTSVEDSNREKEQTLEHLIVTISAIIDARDRSVAGHSEQVARYAVLLAEELGLPPQEVRRIRIASLLHDLGKIGIAEAILHKPGRLTAEEYTTIKAHAELGARILGSVPALQDVARIVGEHHEHYNGLGYPAAKAGEAISIGGRIVAVADTLDTILSDRPYSAAKPLGWALDELMRCAGTQFDPEVVAALLRVEARPENRELFVNSSQPTGAPMFGREEAAS
ncbi:MAG TPA: diguanylate cyclase [Symbiobacteriaceae bacterium]|nr:diguanylate cyclase [Symbiobacteriaceae bacterium]